MPRPRRAQPAPSWASSSRRAKPPPQRNSNLQVVLYDRPPYIPSASSSAPALSLVPPHDCDAYIIDKVVTPFDGWGEQVVAADAYDTDEEDARYAADPQRRTVQRVLNYVVGWPDEPYACELVPCTRILEYVSPYMLEAFEYELGERRERQQREAVEKQKQEQAQKQAQIKKGGKKKPRGRPRFAKAAATAAPTATIPQPTQIHAQQQHSTPFATAATATTAVTTITATPLPMTTSIQITLPAVVSLSPSKQRPAQPTQPTLSLKRPFDTFVEQQNETTTTNTPTETEEESADDGWLGVGKVVDEEEEEEVEDSEDDDNDAADDDDELHAALPPRVTPVPPPAVPSLLRGLSVPLKKVPPSLQTATTAPSIASSTSSSSQASSSSSTKMTRIAPPHVFGMAAAAVPPLAHKDSSIKHSPQEARVTPIPPPMVPRTAKPQPPPPPPPPPEPPESEEEEEVYEVDRLEGDCFTYIDDDADDADDANGAPAPKKLVRFFLVRWKGDWPPDQNPTWEPAANLPSRMVQQYLRRLARQKQARAQEGHVPAVSDSDDDLAHDGMVASDIV